MTLPVQGAKDIQLDVGYRVGEYEIEAKIGEGGFGNVFKAIHPLIGKVVAIKILHRRYSAQPEMVSRFVAEARAVNQIRHRHIIDIFAFGQLEDGRHYYVMEYLDGVSLEEHIQRRGKLDLAEVIPILRALARALDAAHAKGIAHRDLKPENVFMVADEDGNFEPRLLDFGIAKLLYEDAPQEHKTRTGAPMGTPQYMSPEQCRGRDVDHRTDIYGFGIMAYRMLTGKLPFADGDYMEILLAQIGEVPAPPSSLVPSLPASVDQAIDWMLRKEPGERPPNLVTAVRSLEDAAAAMGIMVAPPTVSAVHVALTSPVAAQHTPAMIRSLGGSASVSMPGAALAGDWSKPVDGLAPARSPSTLRKVVLVALGLAGAIVAGLAVHWTLSGNAPSRESVAASSSALGAAGGAHQGSDAPPAASKAALDQDAGAGPEPRLITLVIEGSPPGTEVYGPQGLLGVAPGKIQLLRGEDPLLLTFKADGHRAKTLRVVPSKGRSIQVKLVPKGRGHVAPVRRRPPPRQKKKKRKRDTLEDPFD